MQLKYFHRLPQVKNYYYFNHYINFISKHLNDTRSDGYCEIHHIVPKTYLSDNEKNDKDNLVTLSGRNHYIAHKLLFMSLQCPAMAHALWRMAHGRNGEYISPDEYEIIKREQSAISKSMMSSLMKGKPSPCKGKHLSDEHRKNISIAQTGKKLTDTHIKNLSISHTGNRLSEETKRKISSGNKGKEKTSEWRSKLSASNSGKSHGVRGGVHIYNCTPDGITRKIIPKNELESYLSMGWKKGRPGINKAFQSGCVGTNRGRKWIHIGTTNKVVCEEDLIEYLNQGWEIGKVNKQCK